MDPHIFADPDPGSENLADPTDPDPKLCYCYIALISHRYHFKKKKSDSGFISLLFNSGFILTF